MARIAALLLLLAVSPLAWEESRVHVDTSHQFNPLIALDDAGKVHAIWAETRFNGTMNQRVYYSFGDGKNWSAPEMVRNVKTDQLPAAIGFVGNTLLAAVDHYTIANSKTTEYFVRDGNAWRSLAIEQDLCSVAVAYGKVHKAWISGGILYHSSSADAVSWGNAEKLADASACPKVFFGESAAYAAYAQGTDLMVSGSAGASAVPSYVLSFDGSVDKEGALNLLVSRMDSKADYVKVSGANFSISPVGDFLSIGGLLVVDGNLVRHAMLFQPGNTVAYAWSKNGRNWFAGEMPPIPKSYDQVYLTEKAGRLALAWKDSGFERGRVFVATAAVKTDTSPNLAAEMYVVEQRALFESNVTLFLTVRNTGTEDISRQLRAAIRVGDSEAQNLTIPGLAIGGVYSTTTGISASKEGNITVRFAVDADNEISESSELDNAAEVLLEVLRPACADDSACAYGQYCSKSRCTECASCDAPACFDYLKCKKAELPKPPEKRAEDNLWMLALLALAGAAAGVLMFLWRRRE